MQKEKEMKNLNIGLLIIVTTFWLLGGSNCGETPPPAAQAPLTPSGLSAKASNSAVNLSWTANTEANLKGYNIYWGTQSANLSQSKFVDKSKTSTSISGLKNKTKYYFSINAETLDAKVSTKSTEVSAVPLNTSFQPGDTETYAPGRHGVQKTINIAGKKLTYEVIDGLAIFQGDIILGKATELEKNLTIPTPINTLGMTCPPSTFLGLINICNKWENGVIRYTFADDWGSMTTRMQGRIKLAIAIWESKTNLRFIRSATGAHLVFKNSDGCSSYLGRQSANAGQSINISRWCAPESIIHEIGHSIGLLHEHSRSDRDSHIRINYENIDPDDRARFSNANVFGTDRNLGPYDFKSIMHFSCNAFSKNRQINTIEILDSGISCDDVGQFEEFEDYGVRGTLSEGDVLSTYSLYPPEFSISRHSGVRRNTAFTLNLDFVTEAVKDEYIIWTRSGTSGTIATGRNARFVPLSWPVGEQTLTASVVIKGVTLVSHSISLYVANVDPVVNIVTPSSSGLEFCKNSPVTFKATAYDVDTRPNPNLPDSSISWKINSAAPFATGGTVSHSFGINGNYTITATATDSNGASDSDSVQIRIKNCSSTPPSVFITNPADAPGSGPDLIVDPSGNDTNGYYYLITLRGYATDVEDGTIPASSLVWKTNRAILQPGGPSTGSQTLGAGNNLAVKLYTSCGITDHTITLTATDSNGLMSSIIRIIRINLLC